MQRWFLKVLALILMLGICGSIIAAPSGDKKDRKEDFLKAFQRPPDWARPHTWWHWMDGNVTREGITKDLEAMKRGGIGGAQIFNASLLPVKGDAKFMSPLWFDLFEHASREAARLGLDLAMHNCDGWSSSGGPWITQEQAMKMLVWSEVRGRAGSGMLKVPAQPYTRDGYYRDIAVIGFPTPSEEAVGALTSVTIAGEAVDKSLLVDGDVKTGLELRATEPDGRAAIQFEYAQPVTIRRLTLLPLPSGCESIEVQVSQDGVSWSSIQLLRRGADYQIEWSPNRPSWYLLRQLPETKASKFRVLFQMSAQPFIVSDMHLDGGYILNDFEGKVAARYTKLPVMEENVMVPPGCAVSPEEVVYLSGIANEGEALDAWLSEGEWTIIRLGYTLITVTNHPASPAGIGYECDKLSREAVKWHFDHGLVPLFERLETMNAKSALNQVLIDSYETGPQNWTKDFENRFESQVGYQMMPWLPVLTGRVVSQASNTEQTERFLWDFRRAIGTAWVDAYYKYFSQLLHERGFLVGSEGYGDGVFNEMEAMVPIDVVMTEFWCHAYDDNGATMWMASAVQTQGKRILGAEAFTSGGDGFEYDPYSIKRLGDLEFSRGVNRLIFHTSAHQPDDRAPGFSLGIHGFHPTRHATWFPWLKTWTQYLARCQYILQQGIQVSDILCLTGEGLLEGWNWPQIPEGFSANCITPDTLMGAWVRDGRIILPGGASYSILVLPEPMKVTPALAEKIAMLYKQGALIYGKRFQKSPSLVDYPKCDDQVEKFASDIWGVESASSGDRFYPATQQHASSGWTDEARSKQTSGRVIWGHSFEEALKTAAIQPDCMALTQAAIVAYGHRLINGWDVYFVSNQRPTYGSIEVEFRNKGRVPEFWHPDTGEVELAPIYTVTEKTTRVMIPFDPFGSVFVVFRNNIDGDDAITSATFNGVALDQVKLAGEVVIQKAVYGVLDDPTKCVDMTETIRQMVKQGITTFRATNGLAGRDPAPMTVKSMQIEYTLDGDFVQLNLSENAFIELLSGNTELMGIPSPVMFEKTRKGLFLKAWEAGVVNVKFASGRESSLTVSDLPQPISLIRPWQLDFNQPGALATWKIDTPKPSILLDELVSWTNIPNDTAKFFSGIAEYTISFNMAKEQLDSGIEWVLNLGKVKNFAEIKLNGDELGKLWKPPFQVNVTKRLHAGTNILKLKVANMWVNRLIGDSRLTEDQRISWTAQPFYQGAGDEQLMESGLIGPVKLLPIKVEPVL